MIEVDRTPENVVLDESSNLSRATITIIGIR